MWSQIKSSSQIKTGSEVFRSFDSKTGELCKVVRVSDTTVELVPFKFITRKGIFSMPSLISGITKIELNKKSMTTLYLEGFVTSHRPNLYDRFLGIIYSKLTVYIQSEAA